MFTQLGMLFGPLLKWAEARASYDSDETTRIVARFCADVPRFRASFQAFTKAESGHDYEPQYFKVVNHLGPFSSYATQLSDDDFAMHVRQVYEDVFEAIYSIPIPIASAIHESHTPFSTYCLLKDLCSTARQRVIWMDRYFDSSLFGRYFIDVPRSTCITLVTYPFSECKGSRDQQRYNEFLQVSKLFALERGPSGYRLLTATHFHDRWLECDQTMFALGGSIKDLGADSTFTLSRLDRTADNQSHFDRAIASATEVFGLTNTTHP